MAGFQGDGAIGLGMGAVLPERPVITRRQHCQYVCVRKPMLLRHRLHRQFCQRQVRQGHRFQSVCGGVVVVQAGIQAFHVLHDQVRLDRVQAAAGGAGFLQEHGVFADPHMGLGEEHAFQQLRKQGVGQRQSGIKIAAGGTAREQVVEVGARGTRQDDALPVAATVHDFDRWRAKDFAQFAGGFGAGVLHGLHSVGVVPAGEGMQGCGKRVPVHITQCFVAFAVGGMALAGAKDQAVLQQALECAGSFISQ